MVTQVTIRHLRSSFLPSFTLPPGGREYPYDMPTTMMDDLQTNAFKYVDNVMICNKKSYSNDTNSMRVRKYPSSCTAFKK